MHAATDRAALWWHVLLIVAASAGYEALFLDRSNGELFDEGWPLYAAMRLQAGGVLYRDVFFLFPPGHVLPAWLAYWLDPPGVVLARGIYAAFNVALCAALYFLAGRIMPARYALFSALLVAVDRLVQRSLARIAHAAPRYDGEPPLGHWIEKLIDESIRDLRNEDRGAHFG